MHEKIRLRCEATLLGYLITVLGELCKAIPIKIHVIFFYSGFMCLPLDLNVGFE